MVAVSDWGRVVPRTVSRPSTSTVPLPLGAALSTSKTTAGNWSAAKKTSARRCASRRAFPVSREAAARLTLPEAVPSGWISPWPLTDPKVPLTVTRPHIVLWRTVTVEAAESSWKRPVLSAVVM